MAVEGAEEVAEFRQQRGEVTAGRHQGGERAEQEPHREQRRRRQHRRFEISSDLSPLTIDFALLCVMSKLQPQYPRDAVGSNQCVDI